MGRSAIIKPTNIVILSSTLLVIIALFLTIYLKPEQDEKISLLIEKTKTKKIKTMKQDLCDIRADNMLMKLQNMPKAEWSKYASEHYGYIENCNNKGAKALANAFVLIMKPKEGDKISAEDKVRINNYLNQAKIKLNASH